MAAGASARREAADARARADRLRRAAAEQSWRGRCFDVGAAAEERTAYALDALTCLGYRQLNDVSWPGTRAGNIDHLLVGPSGVFVLDSKGWRGEVQIRDGGVWQDGTSRADAVDKLVAMYDVVTGLLEPLGLPPGCIAAALVLTDHDLPLTPLPGVRIVGLPGLLRWVVSRGERLTDSRVAELFDVLVSGLAPRPAARVAGPPPVPAQPSQSELFAIEDLIAEAHAAAALGSFEDWMVWLHPEQRPLVRRHFDGPARLWGPPGTGKTVLAMHRIAYLAERAGARCLYVSHVRTLPAVIARRYAALSPHTTGQVEFSGMHAWALGFLTARGISVSLDPQAADEAFDVAWLACGQGSVLDRLASPGYWKDEVRTVIRGRGLAGVEQYLALVRAGRRLALSPQVRRQVWELAREYESLLAAAEVHDFDDVLRLALDEEVHGAAAPSYDVVVVDEAQDLTLLAVRLLHRLVGNRPNGLLLLGDTEQSVFTTGYTLTEAGIDVRGRSHCLRTNYRNTREILRFAAARLRDGEDDVLGGEATLALADVALTRSGPVPLLVSAPTEAELYVALAAHVHRVLGRSDASPGEIAVLLPYRAQAERVLRALWAEGVPATDLAQWSGAGDTVQVGTYARCKGLEFRYVYAPVVDASLLSPGWPADGAVSERRSRQRRGAFVATTRARDGLWFGVVSS